MYIIAAWCIRTLYARSLAKTEQNKLWDFPLKSLERTKLAVAYVELTPLSTCAVIPIVMDATQSFISHLFSQAEFSSLRGKCNCNKLLARRNNFYSLLLIKNLLDTTIVENVLRNREMWYLFKVSKDTRRNRNERKPVTVSYHCLRLTFQQILVSFDGYFCANCCIISQKCTVSPHLFYRP